MMIIDAVGIIGTGQMGRGIAQAGSDVMLNDVSQPHLGQNTLLSTNTSSISITLLASLTDRPEQFMGIHFMNPVPIMSLAELIRSIQTDKENFCKVSSLIDKLRQNTEDFPGFIVNCILVPMINEAAYVFFEGIGDVTSIDHSMKLGANRPMGPLEPADFISLDTSRAIMNMPHRGLLDSKYRPCPLLVKYLEAEWLSRKQDAVSTTAGEKHRFQRDNERKSDMKVLVPVKRVIDYNVKARVKADGSGVDLANVKMSMNPFDEIAVEEAIRLKEKGVAEEVVAVSIGVKQAAETLRTALAMGADRAILVVAADDVHQDIEPLAVAKILKAIVDEEQPKLVIAGKQAIDNDMNATGQMLSALLGWSQATFASKLEIEGDSAKVTREVDGGLQTIEVKLPAIVTADLRLNEPRYASLPNIMKAKKKPLDEKTAADYGVDVAPRLEVVKTREPEGRKAGIKVGSVDELVSKLKEAGVI